jgi:hypothetical protein
VTLEAMVKRKADFAGRPKIPSGKEFLLKFQLN